MSALTTKKKRSQDNVHLIANAYERRKPTPKRENSRVPRAQVHDAYTSREQSVVRTVSRFISAWTASWFLVNVARFDDVFGDDA